MLKPLVLFAIWVGYGLWRGRSAGDLRDRAFRVPRGRRLATGALFLLLSLVAGLGAVFAAIAFSNAAGGRETTIGWLLILGGGLVLVHLQILGVTYLATTMVEDRVTERRAETSLEKGSPE